MYNEAMPVEQLVRRLADSKQWYTMHGGQRPYGVSILYAGWDKHLGFQLYLVSFYFSIGLVFSTIRVEDDQIPEYTIFRFFFQYFDYQN